jgi:uracil-DNA glycosylase
MSLKRKAADDAAAETKKPKANASITAFFGQPKPVNQTGSTASSAGSPSVKFDKEAWVAKLTDEQKELLKLEIETLHESWLAHLKDEVTSKEFLDLKRFLKREADANKKVFPPPEDIYSWYGQHTTKPETCVLMLRQVSSHTPLYGQSGYSWPRPIPQS